ncbi:phenylalanine--tRNA ligase subunit alpha [Oscillospiraceae bacterium OttesenSCG-928-F05]|nr:phenylalanine--tRNA ligase subunit alpha [Oscillospiraceae bacterium OttesenSCG-928-F05]
MREKLAALKDEALAVLNAAKDSAELDALRVRFLGKKGELTGILKQMGKLGAEERPVVGAFANDVREKIENAIDLCRTALEAKELERRLAGETIDVTLPGKRLELGHQHPMTRIIDEVKDIFIGMGFEIAEGPEVEREYYNFTALNTPENHPSRDMQDTFYMAEDILLRTQTSPVQVRTMESRKPPIRIIAPGRVYRKDEVDATHSPMFHQIEGLVVDKGITMGDLKGTLELLVKQIYGPESIIRFRPHHFPFTEPSAEVDVMCFMCHGEGCRTCKGEGWIELLGCGMVHPRVLEYCGIDPNVYSGYAFGIGSDRMTMRRFGVSDLRLFFENDVRFLSQF